MIKFKYCNIIICVILLFILIFFYLKEKNILENFNNNINTIPKKIWTFWDGEIPEIINKCIKTWRLHNPTYEIIILNKQNINNYLPNLKINKLKHATKIQHLSDIIRVNILSKYGGFWSDASIICYSSYDYFINLQKEKNVDFVGYYINNDTEYPVIENWFFGCTPNSKLVHDWKKSLMKSQKYNLKKDYIKYIENTTNLDKISNKNYLWMHCALQYCLQNNKNKYKYYVMSACDSPFKYLCNNNWDNKKGFDDIIKCTEDNNCKEIYNTFIKLRGDERNYIQKNNINIFK
tara:strand:- start:756 stop:1628 length:873 start_codon:yes stop_codon:yes gene_type:complete